MNSTAIICRHCNGIQFGLMVCALCGGMHPGEVSSIGAPAAPNPAVSSSSIARFACGLQFDDEFPEEFD